jgi:hypothetical protein
MSVASKLILGSRERQEQLGKVTSKPASPSIKLENNYNLLASDEERAH